MKRVCVFSGSKSGAKESFRSAAHQLGTLIAQRDLELVYGGASVGLMGIVADAVLEAGGRVIGVIPEFLVAKEIAHARLSELHVVQTMHERKALMAQLADGFIAIPGGFGTFEEYCEMLTWSQLRIHDLPCGLLNTEGFYDPLLQLFDQALEHQFLRAEHRELVLEHADPGILLQMLDTFHARKARAVASRGG